MWIIHFPKILKEKAIRFSEQSLKSAWKHGQGNARCDRCWGGTHQILNLVLMWFFSLNEFVKSFFSPTVWWLFSKVVYDEVLEEAIICGANCRWRKLLQTAVISKVLDGFAWFCHQPTRLSKPFSLVGSQVRFES